MLFLVHPVFFANYVIGQDVLCMLKRGGRSHILVFNINTCSADTLCLCADPGYPYLPHDIKFAPDGTIYTTALAFSYYLQKVDTVTYGNNPPKCKISYVSHDPGFWGYGNDCLISDERGNIYSASLELLKYSHANNSWKHISEMPNLFGKYDYHQPAHGSLTRQGKDYYYLASSLTKGTKEDSLKFIKLNIRKPMSSEALFSFSNNIWIFSMFSVRINCDEYKTYIFYGKYKDYLLNSVGQYMFAELNIKTGEITDICNFGKNDEGIPDAVAVPWTQLDSDCLLILDLDEDDSSNTFNDIDYADTIQCKPDYIQITDIDPDVFAYNSVNSLEIFFKSAPLDGSNEFFEASPVPGVNISGSGTQHIVLSGGIAPDYNELRDALKKIVYRNTSSAYTPGERKIAFVGYTNTIISDTAVAHLLITDHYKGAGRDTFFQICSNEGPIALKDYLSAEASQTGIWSGTMTHQGFFDPNIDKEGTFRYIVQNQGCIPDTAIVIIKVNPVPSFSLGNDTIICQGTDLLLQADFPTALNYKWQDGSNGKTFTVKQKGLYYLRITDNNGCVSTDRVNVDFYPGQTTPSISDSTVCYGQTIVWNGIIIDQQGEYLYKSHDKNGCDSSAILKVNYYTQAPVITYSDTLLCQGEKIDWNGITINSSGTFEYLSTGQNLCDSLIKLTVSYYPEKKINIEGSKYFCEGSYSILDAGEYTNYYWSTGANSHQITAGIPDWYTLYVIDENGCLNSDSVFVSMVPPIKADITSHPESCFDYNDGIIQIKNIIGGLGAKKAFLDGKKIDIGSDIAGLAPGLYMLSVIDSLGCKEENTIKIDSAAHYWCDLGADIKIIDNLNLDIKLKHNVANVSAIKWYLNGVLTEENDTIFKSRIDKNSELIVIIYDDNLCEISDTLLITKEDVLQIYIPDVFSPDGNGINDIWSIKGSDLCQEIVSINIFDRWGEKVYRNEKIKFDPYKTELWDGKYKGKNLNPGVYVFVIKLLLKSGEMIIKHGDITIIK